LNGVVALLAQRARGYFMHLEVYAKMTNSKAPRRVQSMRSVKPVKMLAQRANSRGVSLIELMVVVILISIFASLAIPGLVRSTQDRRAYEKATEIAQLMQEARGRALATGSAQMIAMNANGTAPRGQFLLFQAVYNKQPSASCLTANQWGGKAETNPVRDVQALAVAIAPPVAGPGAIPVGGTNVQYAADSDLLASFYVAGAAAGPFTYLCFSPGGRIFYFDSQASASNGSGVPLAGAFEVRIVRAPNGVPEGLTRSVLIDGTDTARVKSF
jgi:prepilin-type N-terminal cleavage/methylation domain-containing protein